MVSPGAVGVVVGGEFDSADAVEFSEGFAGTRLR